MTTDLEATRDHAAQTAASGHRPTCNGPDRTKGPWVRNASPDPACPGCLPDAERVLWLAIAEEIDTYLGSDDDQEALL